MTAILNYSDILQRFGTPLNHIPLPTTSAPKKWQIVAGLAVLSLAAYGGYTLYSQYTKSQYLKSQNDKNK